MMSALVMNVCVCQMGKRRFSGLELTLIVLFLLMLVVAIALIALFLTQNPANSDDKDEGG